MCAGADCDTPLERARTIQTSAGPVSMALCPKCDFLRCRNCNHMIRDRKVRNCPACLRSPHVKA